MYKSAHEEKQRFVAAARDLRDRIDVAIDDFGKGLWALIGRANRSLRRTTDEVGDSLRRGSGSAERHAG